MSLRALGVVLAFVVALSACMGGNPAATEEEGETRTSLAAEGTGDAVTYAEVFRFTLEFPQGPMDPPPAAVEFFVPPNATALRLSVMFVSELPVVSFGSHWLILLQEQPAVLATWKEGGDAGHVATGYLCCGATAAYQTDILPRGGGNLTFETRGWGYLRAEGTLSQAVQEP